jgi:hypothetical protein
MNNPGEVRTGGPADGFTEQLDQTEARTSP